MNLELARIAAFVASWPHPCAVIGGLAILLRVQPRATRDVDLVICCPTGQAALLSALRAADLSYEPADIDEWFAGGLVRAWSGDLQQGLDLIISDVPFLEAVARRAQPVEVDGFILPVATLEDLLLLKLEAGRPQDLDDALALRESFADGLDRAYLTRWQAQLGVDALQFLDGP